MEILETTHFVHLLRPFHEGGRREILAQPKAYAFDTGFICHFRGLSQLRDEDSGALLEHLTLDLLKAHLPARKIHFWRDKQQREIDFVVPGPGGEVTAIECKWSGTRNIRNLDAFRSLYPEGRNLIVTGTDKGDAYDSKWGDHLVRRCALAELPDLLDGSDRVQRKK